MHFLTRLLHLILFAFDESERASLVLILVFFAVNGGHFARLLGLDWVDLELDILVDVLKQQVRVLQSDKRTPKEGFQVERIEESAHKITHFDEWRESQEAESDQSSRGAQTHTGNCEQNALGCLWGLCKGLGLVLCSLDDRLNVNKHTEKHRWDEHQPQQNAVGWAAIHIAGGGFKLCIYYEEQHHLGEGTADEASPHDHPLRL